MRIAILHGPNLNRLGKRNPEKYGTKSLDGIGEDVDAAAERLGVSAVHFQSNSEGALVDWVHEHHETLDAFVVNPAGLTPVAYPLLDALRDTGRPFAVVHISQWHALDGRERADIFADSAAVYLAGAGWHGYALALEALVFKATRP
ncbi:3-dehydroquinate dehydratase-2 [Amycolatopsis bartoniae]|uniref:3-dehydroquinate dehydratase n=1 Tax=Amycolatopsis bartoniae TaxID=941986 RepID=A0A8H9IRQ3_9PSEU|nr:type II 3-dehydroquinate dehydratase [Amycolatopsis bartoniae]MBB2937948.1 3-dehydroquinate dehydratase-2 [Amycolatopsis bartoniae]GHF41905.1 3-dehydroquinate dehydratase [Amycolatopsis bartoniae]